MKKKSGVCTDQIGTGSCIPGTDTAVIRITATSATRTKKTTRTERTKAKGNKFVNFRSKSLTCCPYNSRHNRQHRRHSRQRQRHHSHRRAETGTAKPGRWKPRGPRGMKARNRQPRQQGDPEPEANAAEDGPDDGEETENAHTPRNARDARDGGRNGAPTTATYTARRPRASVGKRQRRQRTRAENRTRSARKDRPRTRRGAGKAYSDNPSLRGDGVLSVSRGRPFSPSDCRSTSPRSCFWSPLFFSLERNVRCTAYSAAPPSAHAGVTHDQQMAPIRPRAQRAKKRARPHIRQGLHRATVNGVVKILLKLKRSFGWGTGILSGDAKGKIMRRASSPE